MFRLCARSLPASNTLLIVTPRQTRLETAPEVPLSLVFVFDVSLSMDQIVNHNTETPFSLLDIAKHSFRLALAMLPASARVAIVSFSDSAEVVCGFLACDEYGKSFLSDKVLQLKTVGCTNLAEGLRVAMRTAEATSQVVVLCDGMPSDHFHPCVEGSTIHERYARVLNEWKPPGVRVTCIGLGYQLDSHLLSLLGTLLHVPDGGDVAPCVVHMIAWMRTVCAADETGLTPAGSVIVECTMSNGEVQLVDLGECIYDVPRDAIVTGTVVQAQLVVGGVRMGDPFSITEEAPPQAAKKALACHRAVAALERVLSPTTSPCDRKMIIHPFVAAESEDDLSQTMRAEVALAVQDDVTWHRWGAHYLRTFLTALKRKRCTNFRDVALQSFARDDAGREARFETIRCEGEMAFATLEAVVGSVKKQPLPDEFFRGGGCIHSTALVEEETNGTIQACGVKPGDRIRTPGGFQTVKFVCYTKVTKEVATLVQLEKLLITAWHPVLYHGEWTFPESVGTKVTLSCQQLVTFVLEHEHVFLADGIPCIALGHNLDINHFAHHDFWGCNIMSQLVALEVKGKVDMSRVIVPK
jgi:hypothetical protein